MIQTDIFELSETIDSESKQLAGVLYYYTKGHNKPSGQAVGGNGCGTFAIVIYGSIPNAEAYSRSHIQDLVANGYGINDYMFLPNEIVYPFSSNPITVVSV